MLIDSEVLPKSKIDKNVLGQIAEKVALVVRETDLTGWFEDGSVIGVIFTELGIAPVSSVTKIIESKVKAGLQGPLARASLDIFASLFTPFLKIPDAEPWSQPDSIPTWSKRKKGKRFLC